MSVLLLDPRQPTLIPLELVVHLRGSVEYTEEVPIRVRWAIADLGADVVDGAPVLVSTERRSDEVQNRLQVRSSLSCPRILLVTSPPRLRLSQQTGAASKRQFA